MIEVTIRAPWAARHTGAPELILNIEGGSTVADATIRAGIPRDDIGILTIKNEIIPPSTILSDGDILEVFPQIIGG